MAEKGRQKKGGLSEKLLSAPLFLPAWFGQWYTRKILTDTRPGQLNWQPLRLSVTITVFGNAELFEQKDKQTKN